jgi:hypothetical protein
MTKDDTEEYQHWMPLLEKFLEHPEVEPDNNLDLPPSEAYEEFPRSAGEFTYEVNGRSKLHVRHPPTEGEFLGEMILSGEFEGDAIRETFEGIYEENQSGYVESNSHTRNDTGSYNLVNIRVPEDYTESEVDATVNSLVEIEEEYHQVQETLASALDR